MTHDLPQHFRNAQQDHFWKFATEQWKADGAEVVEGSVPYLAQESAEKYLKTLHTRERRR